MSTDVTNISLKYEFGKKDCDKELYLLNVFNNDIEFGTIVVEPGNALNRSCLNLTYFENYFNKVFG